MPFSSLFFLFFFLPVLLLLYYIGGHRLRNGILVLASLLFYAWGGLSGLPLLLGIIGFNYLCGLFLPRLQPGWKRKTLLALSIAANLSPLYYYKYTGFVLQNFNYFLPGLQMHIYVPQQQDIPLGISFLAFHAISYLVDVATKKAPLQKNPLLLGLYFSFFPKILSGPILRYSEAASQLRLRPVSLADFSTGVERFIIGLGKKMLLANALAELANPIFEAPATSLSVGIAWLGAVCYTLQIYFDFSGYSDMAIGLGKMFGFQLPENFNFPYFAQSVREFWQRWHITLSRWFRDYLYIPLGGNRQGPFRTACNLCTVFLLCGLWHGASWNFVVWGMLHGLFISLEHWRLGKFLTRLPRLVRHLYLLLFILVSWVFFRTTTLTGAGEFLQAMAGMGRHPEANPWIYMNMGRQVTVAAVLSCLLSFPVLPSMTRCIRRWGDSHARFGVLLENSMQGVKVAGLSVVFLVAVMEMATTTYKPFIYFRF